MKEHLKRYKGCNCCKSFEYSSGDLVCTLAFLRPGTVLRTYFLSRACALKWPSPQVWLFGLGKCLHVPGWYVISFYFYESVLDFLLEGALLLRVWLKHAAHECWALRDVHIISGLIQTKPQLMHRLSHLFIEFIYSYHPMYFTPLQIFSVRFLVNPKS